MRTTKTQIVVAGCGPVGSIAGYYLAQQGVDVIVLESEHEVFSDLRASTLHPPTIEMLDQLGVATPLIEKGLKAPVYQYRNRRTDERFEFDLGELSDITKFPYRLQCEQYKVVNHLVDLMDAHPHSEVRFSNRINSFSQTDTGVDIYVETPVGIEKIEAEYLIASDGANSIVRKWLEIEFEGFTYPEKFLCLSTEEALEEYFQNLSLVNYIADPDEWVVLLRVPTLWRVLVPAENSNADDYLLSDEKKNIVFDKLTGDGPKVETNHRTIYRVHQRVAKEYFKNRVALVGDAAHLNNPLGGFGMNSGIHDAWNLCEKLVDIVKGDGDPNTLLPLFERQRQTITRNFVQAQTIQNKESMENTSEKAQNRKQREMQDILGNDAKRRDFLMRQSMFTSLHEASAIQ